MTYSLRSAAALLLLASLVPLLHADLPRPEPRPSWSLKRLFAKKPPADLNLPVVIQPCKMGSLMELHIPQKFLTQLRAEGARVEPDTALAEARPHFQKPVAGLLLTLTAITGGLWLMRRNSPRSMGGFCLLLSAGLFLGVGAVSIYADAAFLPWLRPQRPWERFPPGPAGEQITVRVVPEGEAIMLLLDPATCQRWKNSNTITPLEGKK